MHLLLTSDISLIGISDGNTRILSVSSILYSWSPMTSANCSMDLIISDSNVAIDISLVGSLVAADVDVACL